MPFLASVDIAAYSGDQIAPKPPNFRGVNIHFPAKCAKYCKVIIFADFTGELTQRDPQEVREQEP